MKHILTTFTTTAIATAVATILLASCSSEEYLGDTQHVTKDATISFSGSTSKTFRTSTLMGPAAAEKLADKFVVYGTKTTSAATQTVFEHYNVAYTPGSEYTTTSNTSGWEYVGIDPNPLNDKLTIGDDLQTIKYWDFAADHYDYIAFSSGTATQQTATGTAGDPGYPGTATAGNVIITPVDIDHITTAAYTLTGDPDDLSKCYIADRITATKDAAVVDGISYPYLDPMRFNFHNIGAKIRVGLYETIDGYSVKDVKFYAADDTYATDPLLFAGSESIPTDAATITVSFPKIANAAAPDYNKAHVSLATIEGHTSQDLALPALDISSFATKENLEGGRDSGGNPVDPGQVFLGRSSANATTTDFQPIVPASAPHALTLKMDYTLLSTDISKETITVRGATAVIPAEFCNWQSNTSYTYLFKITANTNGWTNPTDLGHVGLYPVTLDALVAATEEGAQQTITLMDAPSITTYAKGDRMHEEVGTNLHYYEAEDYNLYICIQPNTNLMNSGNVRLFTAEASDASPIIEATVADVIKRGTESPAGTYTDDPYVVKTAGAPTLTIVDAIPAADAPYNTIVPGNFAVFKPTTAGTYVFEYTSPEEHYTYDEYHALTGNEGVTQSDYDTLVASNSPLLLKPNKHYKVIIVK